MLTDDLLELQRIDTLVDQLTYRRANLAERATARAAADALTAHRGQRAASAERAEELEMAIDALERDGEQMAAQRSRLEGQLKTVIAPRAAEALLHELSILAERRNDLDDQELAHLEEQSELVDTIAGLDAATPELEAAAKATATAQRVAEVGLDEELAALADPRADVVERLEPAMVARYDQLRARQGGIAVSRLDGSRCGGCHLDLSTSELDELRSVPAGELAECPNCGRLLVP